MSLINPLTPHEIMAFLSVTDSELFDQTYEAVVETSESAQTVQEFFNADLSTPALRCITPNPLEQDAWDELHDDPETKSGIIVKESTAEMQDAPSKTHDDTFTMKVAGAAVKREYESEIQFHSAMSDTKEPWVRIIPRRGNALENRPVVITLEVLSKHFHESIEMAAKKIGIGKSTMKHVCRRLGVVKWPYTHKGQRRRCPQRASSSNSQSM